MDYRRTLLPVVGNILPLYIFVLDLPHIYPRPLTLQTFTFGGGSGNDVKESYELSPNSAYSTASGMLCGIGALFQDASVRNDPLITRIGFLFLQEVDTISISDINTTHFMPTDDQGYSMLGQITQRVLCNPSLPTACTNTLTVQQGWTSETSLSKAHTHSSVDTVNYQQSSSAGTTIGDMKGTGVQVTVTLSFGWGTTDTKSSTTTDSTTVTRSTMQSMTMTDTCNCPSNITQSTYW